MRDVDRLDYAKQLRLILRDMMCSYLTVRRCVGGPIRSGPSSRESCLTKSGAAGRTSRRRTLARTNASGS